MLILLPDRTSRADRAAACSIALRLEVRDRRNGRQDRDQADRNRAAEDPHHAAVPHGGAKQKLAIVPFVGEGSVSHVLHGRCHAQCACPPDSPCQPCDRQSDRAARTSYAFTLPTAPRKITLQLWPGRGGSGRPVAARAHECAKMSSAAQPARSSRTRSGRNRKQASASPVRPSRASMTSSFSLKACRCSTSEAA